jgi:hypothetical protein
MRGCPLHFELLCHLHPIEKIALDRLAREINHPLVLSSFCMVFVVFCPTACANLYRPARHGTVDLEKVRRSLLHLQNSSHGGYAADAPRWTVTANDCQANKAPTKNTASVLDREYRDDLCRLLTTAEGKEYLEESIKNFEKDKIFTYSSIFIIEFMLLWLLLGFMLMIHYTNKVRHFILLEQQKAIHCVQGSFAATGIYAIYQELEERDARRPRR